MDIAVSFSLRTKLLLYSITLILVPVLLIGTLAYRESVRAARENILRSKLETLQLAQAAVDGIFRDAENQSLFMIQNPSLRDLLLARDATGVKQDLLPELIETNQYLWFLIGSRGYLDSIYIRGMNGVVLDPDTTSYEIGAVEEQRIRGMRGMYLWYPDRVVTKYHRTEAHVFSIIRLMNDVENITRPLGFLVINVSESAISRIYADKGVSPGSRFYVVDADGIIRSASDARLLGRPLSDLYGPSVSPSGEGTGAGAGVYREWTAPASASAVRPFGTRRFVSVSLPVQTAGLTLVNVTPAGELAGAGSGFREVVLVGVLLSLLLSGLFAVLFSRRTLANIRRLSEALRAVGAGLFPVELDLGGTDEIALLGASVSTMSKTIATLIKENYEITLKEKEAELMALEAQVSPHFLYNVLDTIYWKCRLERAYKSAELLKALSDIFRMNLDHGDRLIPVRREIQHVRSYLLIQMEKYADRIRVEFDVQPDIEEVPVLKQVLQPIVENAIVHGFAAPGRGGCVQVRAYGTEADVVFEVVDDGVGIDPRQVAESLQKGPRGHGIGLKNVDERLRINFGDAYRLSIRTNHSGGATVVIRQPRSAGAGGLAAEAGQGAAAVPAAVP